VTIDADDIIPPDAVPIKPKRATVTSVDKKIDQVLEGIDALQIEVSGLRSVLKELLEALSNQANPEMPELSDENNRMFG
jgi:FtsZ-binding cell division protein ZapB